MSDRPTDKQLQIWADGFSSRGHATEIAVECVRLRKQVAAAKAVCEASRRCHNRDYHMSPKWADNCSLCRAHKEFEAVMKETEL